MYGVRLRVLSLGAGVQSTTLALLAAAREVGPMPDGAIFADTGDESAATYVHLEWLRAQRLPFPIWTVRAWEGYGKPGIRARLSDEILASARGEARSESRPPFFTLGADGSKGMIRRQCTGDYKIDPIERRLRELLGLRRGQRWPLEPRVELWIGISTDEATRMKPSQRPAIVTRWPLIERGMSRRDCERWLRAHGHPIPPKSACVFCPFHSDAEWRRMKEQPAEWARAVEIDEAIRTGIARKSLSGALFVHSKRIPLKLVDLRTAEEHGQTNLFENECVGVCGV